MAGKPETSRENGKLGGRPKGARTLINVREYFTDKELKEFWDDLKTRAKTDKTIALYFAEQLTGRAMQAIDHTTNGKDLPTPILGGITKDEN